MKKVKKEARIRSDRKSLGRKVFREEGEPLVSSTGRSEVGLR